MAVQNLSNALYNFLLKQSIYAAILFLIVSAVSIPLRKRSATLHLGLWTLVLIRLILPPDLSHPLSLRNVARVLFHFQPAEMEQTIMSVHDEGNVALKRASTPSVLLFISQRQNLLGTAWSLGFVIFSISFVVRHRRWHNLAATAVNIHCSHLAELLSEWQSCLAIKRRVRLKASTKIQLPFTIGIWRPVIVLPMSLLDNYTMEQSTQTNAECDADGRRKCTDLSTTNSEHIHAVIAHEMVHIKRLDDLWIVLQNFIQAAYFFHPAIWLTNHRIYIARECICDSIVLAQDRLSRRAYCRGLISSLKLTLRGLKGAGVFAAFASAHKVVKIRILHIKKGEKMKIPFSTKILFICIAVFILPMASQSKRTVHVANSSMTATDESLAFFNPLTGGEYKITSTYGERKHPISGERVFHRGVDLAAKAGTPVYAAAAGVITAAVTVVEQDNRMGKYVEVQHDNGYMTRYTQLRDITVQAGKTVKSGEKIGEVGSTGVSTGPHLHFELWKEGEHVNPADYIDF